MLTDDQVKQFQENGYLVFEWLMERFVRGEYSDLHIVRGH
ncbi:MAG: hypothetical protein ACI8V2_004640 [Candidatus Latescibacterota bacterium]|jgi:hypothetical protein